MHKDQASQDSMLINAYRESPNSKLAQVLSSRISEVSKLEEFLTLEPQLIYRILQECERIPATDVIEIVQNILYHQKIDVAECVSNINTDRERVIDHFKDDPIAGYNDSDISYSQDDQQSKLERLERIVNSQQREIAALTDRFNNFESTSEDTSVLNIVKNLIQKYETQEKNIITLRRFVDSLMEKVNNLSADIHRADGYGNRKVQFGGEPDSLSSSSLNTTSDQHQTSQSSNSQYSQHSGQAAPLHTVQSVSPQVSPKVVPQNIRQAPQTSPGLPRVPSSPQPQPLRQLAGTPISQQLGVPHQPTRARAESPGSYIQSQFRGLHQSPLSFSMRQDLSKTARHALSPQRTPIDYEKQFSKTMTSSMLQASLSSPPRPASQQVPFSYSRTPPSLPVGKHRQNLNQSQEIVYTGETTDAQTSSSQDRLSFNKNENDTPSFSRTTGHISGGKISLIEAEINARSFMPAHKNFNKYANEIIYINGKKPEGINEVDPNERCNILSSPDGDLLGLNINKYGSKDTLFNPSPDVRPNHPKGSSSYGEDPGLPGRKRNLPHHGHYQSGSVSSNFYNSYSLFSDNVSYGDGGVGGMTSTYSIDSCEFEIEMPSIDDIIEAECNCPWSDDIFSACLSHNTQLVMDLVKENPTRVRARNPQMDYVVPLHLAAKQGDNEMIKIFVKAGSDINEIDSKGWTPIFYAAQEGQYDTCRFLITCGARTAQKDVNGWTPVYVAAVNNRADLLELFFKNGASIDSTDRHHIRSPLQWAAVHGNISACSVLLQRGANVEAKDKEGLTPLLISAQHGHSDLTRLFCIKGAKIDATDEEGRTPLYWSVRNNHPDCVTVLLSAGANVNVSDMNGVPLIFTAVKYGSIELVELLIIQGATKTKLDKCNNNLLHIAVERGDKSMVEHLIAKGISTLSKNSQGMTPLDVARERGRSDIISAFENKPR